MQNSFAEVVLCDLLETCTAKYTLVSHHEWVDDLTQRTEGTRKRVEQRLIKAGIHLAAGLQGQGFIISKKSKVVASTAELARAIQKGINEAGFPIQAARANDDLGIARGIAGQRHRGKHIKRMQGAMQRGAKSANLPGRKA